MPNDHMLVVKEHPAAIATSTRPRSFMRALRRRAGVTVVEYRTDSRALIERAALTISVTGTSTLEAFLLGRPALTLGPSLIAGYIGGVAPLSSLATRIKGAIGSRPDDDAIARAIAEIFSVSYDFILRTPGLPDEPMLRRRNIDRFLFAILDHAERQAALPKCAAGPEPRIASP
jgi:hypothetical protein